MGRGRPEVNAGIPAISQSDAAEMLNVGRESVQSGRKVINSAIPELITAVEQDEVAVSLTAKVSQLPEKNQHRMMDKVNHGGAKPAKAFKRVLREKEAAEKMEDAEEPASLERSDDEPFYAEHGIEPADFQVATRIGGALERLAELAASTDVKEAVRGMMPDEVENVCTNATTSVVWLESLIEELRNSAQDRRHAHG
jgi:hypothetical protein